MSTKAEGPWGDTWHHVQKKGPTTALCRREIHDHDRLLSPEQFRAMVQAHKPGADEGGPCPQCWYVMCGEVVDVADLERGRGVKRGD